jgi:hypothetical protein
LPETSKGAARRLLDLGFGEGFMLAMGRRLHLRAVDPGGDVR